jgi:hypothetical protein
MKQTKGKYYGIVEGFFSKPLSAWTPKERLDTLKFISLKANEINTYFYCPKQDPFITNIWDKPYSSKLIKEIKEVISYCNKSGISYVYGLNPQIDRPIDEKVVVRKIVNKFNQLKSLGCSRFALLFDDVPLAYDVVESLSDSDKVLIESIVRITNRVFNELKNDIDEFWFCGPDYCFYKKTYITKALRTINTNIPFLWTGRNVFTSNIGKEDVDLARKVVGKERKLVWWSNFPVNDCEQNIGMYNMGAFRGPTQKTLDKLYGIVVNPMREPYINLPFYAAFSQYISKPQNYDRNKAWRFALKQEFGNDYEDVKFLFDEFTQMNPTETNPKWLYKFIIKNLTLKEIKKMLSCVRSINKNQPNKKWGIILKDISGEAIIYLQILEDIIKRNNLKITQILSLTFPTNPKVSRYYAEIYKIVKKRLSLLPTKYRKRDNSKKYTNQYIKINKKYAGRKKLNISKTDEIKFQKTNKEIIRFEAGCLKVYLTDSSVSTKQKLLTMSRWQNINRFFTED